MCGKNKLTVKKRRRTDSLTLIFFFSKGKDDFLIFGKRYYPLIAFGATFPRFQELISAAEGRYLCFLGDYWLSGWVEGGECLL